MEPCTQGPVKPVPFRSISNIARGAFELGELQLARSRLKAPKHRLHVLIALISAAKELGLSTRVMEPEARACLDTLLAGNRERVLGKTGPVVREQIQTWLEQPTHSHGQEIQTLAAALSMSRHQAPFHCIQVLLGAGHVRQARELACEWDHSVVRQRLETIVSTGLVGHDRDRRFVVRPFDDDFPPSLPRLIAMAHHSRPGRPLSADQRTQAERLLGQLKPADRQTALAHWTGAAYHADGLAAGEGVVRAIRYQSCRRLARLRLLMASLDAGRTDDAWRTLERLPTGAFRERAQLLLARHLIRQGRRRKARKLLVAPSATPRLEERAQLLCEIEPWRVESVWNRWCEAAARRSEDLSCFDAELPQLEQRWTTLALRAALRHGPPEDDRRWARRNIRIPPKSFRNLVQDRAAVRSCLRELEAEGHELTSVLSALRWVAPDDAMQPIWSEYFSRRAYRLAKGSGKLPPRRLVEAFARGLFKTDPPTNGRATSVENCAQDEGVSLSPRAGPRRRVILGAVKRCLKTWLVEGQEPHREALDARLRTLSNLGGSLAAEQLARILESSRQPGTAYYRAFAVLTSMAPERAAHLLFGPHCHILLERGDRVRRMLVALEDHGVLETGFSGVWHRFISRVRVRLGTTRGVVWLRQLLTAWPGGRGALPTLAAVQCCIREIAGTWPATGDQLVQQAQRHVRALQRIPTSRLPATLLEDPLAIRRLLWLRPRVSRSGRQVAEEAWRTDLITLRDEIGEVDVSMVLALARRLNPKTPRPLARRLLVGRHPVEDASRAVRLPGGKGGNRYRLRYLDKRRDLFTFLRLADCVPCCFDSASSWYRTHRMGWWILDLWKDPLSFCFHVDRSSSRDDWEACGFIFGSYSVGNESPAVLLNGIYLKHQENQLRAAILRAIEETFCRPLGMLRVAIANCHAGRGSLPSEYIQRPLMIHRPRALRFKGRLETRIYDDISSQVNQTCLVSHLYWRHL